MTGPFPLTPQQIAWLCDIARHPREFSGDVLAWHDGERWIGMHGFWDDTVGRFRADPVIHAREGLPCKPTHWVSGLAG